jgi:hypothetical protein
VNNPQDLVDRYVALWNEPDPERRRAAIEALWAPDGSHVSPSLEAHGYDELAARVERSHQRWVVDEGYVFRAVPNALHHHDTVTFSWEMLPRQGGEVISEGRDFFLVDPSGRLRSVYQFIVR